MQAPTASALRRAGFVTLGLALTGGAHSLVSDSLRMTPLAPVIWLNVFLAVFLLGRVAPSAGFGRWSTAHAGAALVGLQLGAHEALGRAPWLLGLGAHHVAGPTVGAIAAHVGAALLLLVALRLGERLLASLVRALARFADAVRRRPRLPRAVRTLHRFHAPALVRRAVLPLGSRGPPLAFS